VHCAKYKDCDAVTVKRDGSNIFQTICSQMAVRLSALRVGRPLPPGQFLLLISVRDSVDLRNVVRSSERTSDLIWNRTHDLPACSIVSEQTTPLILLQFQYVGFESILCVYVCVLRLRLTITFPA
jgi:hypothetical protein